MNRRQFAGLAGTVAATVCGTSLLGQEPKCSDLGTTAAHCEGQDRIAMSGVTIGANVQLSPMFDKPQLPIEERRKQYAICKERGHQVGGYPTAVNAIWPPPKQHPWCKFCLTTFWETTSTTLHEVDVP